MKAHLAIALALLACAPSQLARAQGMPQGFGQAKQDLTNLSLIGARGEADGAAIQVREVSEGGPAARGGLRVGDELIGVSGRAFQPGQVGPVEQLWAGIDAHECARKKGPLLLSVRRGGEESELKLKIPQYGKKGRGIGGKKNKRTSAMIKAGLAFLARTQAGNGAFPTTLGGKTGLVVVTSLGGLAFLSAGTSAKPGSPLGRAIDYVVKHANVKERGGLGFGAGGGGNWNQENWEHAYALMFLSEVARKTHRPDVKAKVAELTSKLFQTQEESGGWAHGPGGPNALGYVELEIVSNYALLGMGAAQQLGVELDEGRLEKALRWIVGTSNGDGGVGYSHRQGQKGFGDPGRTAGALVAFAALGQSRHPFFAKMANFYRRNLTKLPEGHVSPAMHILAGAMASKLLGKKAFKQFLAAYELHLLGARCFDGSFAATPTQESRSMRNNTDLTVGPRWTTATYVLVLTLEQDKLPLLLGGKGGKGGKDRVRTGR